MTQKEFIKIKEWVEDVTGCEFDDDHASYDEDGCHFSKYVGRYTATLNIDNDGGADVWLLTGDEYDIEVYTSRWNNNAICLSVFAHIVNYN